MKHIKKYKKTFVLLIVLFAVSILGSNIIVERSAENLVYTNIQDIPNHKVGLVLGCSKHLSDGRQNLFFKYRIQAALDLYTNKKIEYLIVSGDNSVKYYDEPTDMRNELIRRGIPEAAIYRDYAGFRTLDSVIRTAEVFGEKKFVVISQEFHVERAVCIAKAKGLKVVGYNAKEVNVFNSFKTKVREYLARTKMVLDIYVLNVQPKFLGPKIKIPSVPT